jgi:lipopolysaccharide/colanic/teichoic acid biosynthesis glycosyltransferase
MSGTFYKRTGKRALDLLLTVGGLVVLSPLFAVVAILIKLTSPGPVFFRQIRAGQFDQPFRIFKFRSMRTVSSAAAITNAGDDANSSGALLTKAGDPRITAIGRWLRATKVDELPQLLNVLAGHMSLVGPRPEVPEYVAVYTTRQRRVLLARPGITGLVAMNNVHEEELLAAQPDKHIFYQTVLLPAKLAWDLQYCENIRLTEDLRILFGTFFKIFRRSTELQSPLLQAPEKQT